MSIFDFTSDVTSGSYIDTKGGFTSKNSAQLNSHSDTGNTDGSQNIESDQWDFEESIGNKISDGKAFGELWSCIVLSHVQAIQRKTAEVFVKIKTPVVC